MTKRFLVLISAFTILTLCYSCAQEPEQEAVDIDSGNESESSDQAEKLPRSGRSLAEVHFYYENSHSMDGYVQSGSDFNNNVYRLLLEFKREYQLKGYFINDTVYPQNDLTGRFADLNLETEGMSKSNHQYIYDRAIRTSGGNKMSVVVTDGIYSIEGRDLEMVSLDIENAFYSSLKRRDLDMAVLKFESSFTGKYYSEKCKQKVQHLKTVTRPYYVMLFAEKSVLDQVLEEHFDFSHSGLSGFVDIARFFRYDSENADFTLLQDGEEKVGRFDGVGNNFTYEAIQVNRKGNLATGEKGIQLALAADFSNLSVPDSYILDVNNYVIEGGDYKLIEVKELSELSNSSISMSEIRDIQYAARNFQFTHMLVMRGEKDLFSTVQVKLANNMPNWITYSSIESDCNIENQTDKTITFLELMKGVNNAYIQVNNRAHFVSLEFEVKS